MSGQTLAEIIEEIGERDTTNREMVAMLNCVARSFAPDEGKDATLFDEWEALTRRLHDTTPMSNFAKPDTEAATAKYKMCGRAPVGAGRYFFLVVINDGSANETTYKARLELMREEAESFCEEFRCCVKEGKKNDFRDFRCVLLIDKDWSPKIRTRGLYEHLETTQYLKPSKKTALSGLLKARYTALVKRCSKKDHEH